MSAPDHDHAGTIKFFLTLGDTLLGKRCRTQSISAINRLASGEAGAIWFSSFARNDSPVSSGRRTKYSTISSMRSDRQRASPPKIDPSPTRQISRQRAAAAKIRSECGWGGIIRDTIRFPSGNCKLSLAVRDRGVNAPPPRRRTRRVHSCQGLVLDVSGHWTAGSAA